MTGACPVVPLYGGTGAVPMCIKLRIEKRQTVKYHAVKWTVMNFTGVASHD